MGDQRERARVIDARARAAVERQANGRQPEVVTEAASARDASSSLESHLAMVVAERLLASDSPDDRLRGLERLLGFGQREAIDRVLRALDSTSLVGRDPRARLIATRGLVPFLSREPVRKVFERELAVEPGGAPTVVLVRETAAMGLAANGEKSSIEVLVAALRQGGSIADVAGRALLAHPPKTLEPFASRDGLPVAVSSVLGQLGDQRAVALLRGALTFERKSTADDESLLATEEDDGKARARRCQGARSSR